jgi:Peptidase family M1 domain
MFSRVRWAGALVLALLVAAVVVAAHGRAEMPAPASRLPPLSSDYPLPLLPERSPRNANYTIEARLDTSAHTLEGSLLLEWRNLGDIPIETFPFHLYWNAYRNNLSSVARGDGTRAARFKTDRDYGFIRIKRIVLLGKPDVDLTRHLRFLAPDDQNGADRTVAGVQADRPVPPGGSARFRIDWTARIPYGSLGRAGWIHDYFFMAQWFPKIGVFRKDHWNAHQFHAQGEFFSDYGNYDVALTLPQGFVVGATGKAGPAVPNADGTQTVRFLQEDVHDFAWAASPRFLERHSRFEDLGYPPVDIRLLVQPEHAHLADRYLAATQVALRSYGAWGAPYPFDHLTVVDPAWFSASGGMEYPTLFTGGTYVQAPLAMQSPESVTVHEAGHQFWYSLVGTNEFEEAWLDEGLNDYHEAKALNLFYGPAAWGRRYFGGSESRGRPRGYAVLAPGVFVGRGEKAVADLRRLGERDPMARNSWEFENAQVYTVNAYHKPALVFQTLEALLGDETMTRVLRTWAYRYRFQHPTTRDFIATVNEVSGKDWQWFFDETFYSSGLCDYAIEVKDEPRRRATGFVDGAPGDRNTPTPAITLPRGMPDDGLTDSTVSVRRLGAVRMPVEIVVEFADGRLARESWDGRDRWVRFTYAGPKIRRAIVDPDHKLAIDIDPSNNAWRRETGLARQAAYKWSARFFFWLQNLLELHTVLG